MFRYVAEFNLKLTFIVMEHLTDFFLGFSSNGFLFFVTIVTMSMLFTW